MRAYPLEKSTVITKRKPTVLMNCIAKFGDDSDESVNETLRDLHIMIVPSDDNAVETRAKTRKRKPK